MMVKSKQRSEISSELTWNIEKIYNDIEAWESDFAQVKAELQDLEKHRGAAEKSATDLLKAIEAILCTSEKLGRICVFASMRSDEDTRIGENLERDGRAGSLAVSYSEAISWFDPELLAIDNETLEKYFKDEPELSHYRHFIDDIRRSRDHTLDPEREQLLAMSGDMAGGSNNVFNALDNADLKLDEIVDEDCNTVPLTKAFYSKYLRSQNREVRKSAFEKFMDAYSGNINTFAANLDSKVKAHCFYSRARNHESTLDAALHNTAVPADVFHSLIDTVNKNLPIIHRYANLKKKILNLDDFAEHDLYVPLFPKGEFTFSYKEACDVMCESLAPLGQEYVDVARAGLDGRWIDVHENEGKRGGAYSSGAYGTDPYILLNWSDMLRDTFTLAHEMGHSMHSYLAAKNQPYVYSNYPIFTAEVASTFNEALLMEHLLKTDDRHKKLYLLDVYLDQINSTVFRQTMFAEFEYEIHRRGEQGLTLTAESLDELYLEILRKYWGPDVEFDKVRSSRTWCRIPHFYYNYYVYQYSTAFAGAAALVEKVLSGDKKEREQYLGFMRSGASVYPVETMKTAGVDMASAEPVEAVFSLFEKLMDQVEQLLENDS
jgi:oligoendopeptidase F